MIVMANTMGTNMPNDFRLALSKYINTEVKTLNKWDLKQEGPNCIPTTLFDNSDNFAIYCMRNYNRFNGTQWEQFVIVLQMFGFLYAWDLSYINKNNESVYSIALKSSDEKLINKIINENMVPGWPLCWIDMNSIRSQLLIPFKTYSETHRMLVIQFMEKGKGGSDLIYQKGHIDRYGQGDGKYGIPLRGGQSYLELINKYYEVLSETEIKKQRDELIAKSPIHPDDQMHLDNITTIEKQNKEIEELKQIIKSFSAHLDNKNSRDGIITDLTSKISDKEKTIQQQSDKISKLEADLNEVNTKYNNIAAMFKK